MKINLTKALTFFKGWGIESSYVLGLLFADGNVCHELYLINNDEERSDE